MKFYSLAPLAFLVACASSNTTAPKNSPQETPKGIKKKVYEVPKVSVEVKNKDGQTVHKIDEQDMSIYERRIKAYEGLSVGEIEVKLKEDVDAEQTTILIETLFHKSMDNYNQAIIKRREQGLDQSLPVDIHHVVRIFASLVPDTRAVVLEESDTTLWMEAKSIYEKPQIGIYAAFLAQRVTQGNLKAFGYTFNKHRSGILFCTKNGFAQVKNDVRKNWLKWWAAYGIQQYGD